MKSSIRRRWTREELIVAFNLYCRTPFGKLHKSNPHIIQLANTFSRSPSAVAMKLCNFASLDPLHVVRNVKGLTHASKSDREVWNEFNSNWDQLAFESQLAHERMKDPKVEPTRIPEIPKTKAEETETVGETRVRLVQAFFRQTVMATYENKCALCKLALPELLVASHIIPWSANADRRADPTNGLALCALHDKAFDRGLLTLDRSFNVVLSRRAKLRSDSQVQTTALREMEGQALIMPMRFCPDQVALRYHREHVFQL